MKETFIKDASHLLGEANRRAPEWIRDFRNEGLRHFQMQDYPADASEIGRTSWIPATDPASSAETSAAGIELQWLSRSSNDSLKAFQEVFGGQADLKRHSFAALNSAMFRDALLIRIPAGFKSREPITIVHRVSSNGKPLASFPRVVVRAEPESESTIIETFEGSSNYFSNSVTEIAVEDNAAVNHVRFGTDGLKAHHVGLTSAKLHRNSRLRSTVLTSGGKFTRNDLDVVLAGEGSETQLNGLYLANDAQTIDHHTLIDHAKPQSSSRELYKGILNDRAHTAFFGKIIVRPNAQKTDARQTNRNLLLSNDALADTTPQLEIHADDVKCAHGATIGRLDEQALFYLRTRGISLDESRWLLMNAFAMETLSLLSDLALHSRASLWIQERLKACAH